jgi:POT family proton-dependent oligopeptide transporter
MSVCLALGEAFVCKLAVDNALECLINDAIFTALFTDPLLVWNYGTMGVLISFIAGVLFWFTFRDLDAGEDKLKQIPAGGFQNN